MISFSTCWNSGRHTAGDEMLKEIVDLGFEYIELGHGIRISLMPGIQQMFDAGEVRFSSLHNFCPLPVEVMSASPDCYQLSVAYSKERERAIKQTFQTIDFAQRLGAPFVIMHLGEVPIGPVTDSLIRLAKNGKLLSREYVKKKIRAVEKREAAAPPYLERVKEAMKRIVEYAASKNIKLGIEGRRGYEEIPSERELPVLLDELDSPVVGYWHDLGHIQIKENLTLSRSRRMVENDRAAHARLSRAGLHLAGARSSAAFRRRCRSCQTRSAVAEGLPIRLGNESAQNGR